MKLMKRWLMLALIAVSMSIPGACLEDDDNSSSWGGGGNTGGGSTGNWAGDAKYTMNIEVFSSTTSQPIIGACVDVYMTDDVWYTYPDQWFHVGTDYTDSDGRASCTWEGDPGVEYDILSMRARVSAVGFKTMDTFTPQFEGGGEISETRTVHLAPE